MASAIAQAYNEGIGAEPPAGSKGRAPGQWVRGRSPPEAEAFCFFGLSMEAANLPTFLKFANAKKSDTCVIFSRVVTKLSERLCPPARA